MEGVTLKSPNDERSVVTVTTNQFLPLANPVQTQVTEHQ